MPKGRLFEPAVVLSVMAGRPAEEPAAAEKQAALIGFMYGKQALTDATGILYAEGFNACTAELRSQFQQLIDICTVPARHQPVMLEAAGFPAGQKIRVQKIDPQP